MKKRNRSVLLFSHLHCLLCSTLSARGAVLTYVHRCMHAYIHTSMHKYILHWFYTHVCILCVHTYKYTCSHLTYSLAFETEPEKYSNDTERTNMKCLRCQGDLVSLVYNYYQLQGTIYIDIHTCAQLYTQVWGICILINMHAFHPCMGVHISHSVKRIHMRHTFLQLEKQGRNSQLTGKNTCAIMHISMCSHEHKICIHTCMYTICKMRIC